MATTLEELKTQLAEVNATISRILNGAQASSVGDRRRENASIGTLLAERTRLAEEIRLREHFAANGRVRGWEAVD